MMDYLHDYLEQIYKPVKKELDKITDKKVKDYATVFALCIICNTLYKVLEGGNNANRNRD